MPENKKPIDQFRFFEMTSLSPPDDLNYETLSQLIKVWASDLGFQQAGITGIELAEDEKHLLEWLKKNYHGEMDYMKRHGTRRSRPDDLLPGTLRVISVRMDYWPSAARPADEILENDQLAYVSRYALGRDYHKVLRARLQKLANKIETVTGQFGYRAFVDSAPVLEKALARNSGLGWLGKHTNLINRHAGSWFFLGELFTDLPLPVDTIYDQNYCGSCTACIDVCPTKAIVAPYQVDARRCISYLTIESRESIPEHLRPHLGNRIYGCDDCQLVCPWNRYATPTQEDDFSIRNNLDAEQLIRLFAWDEQAFLKNTEGSAIRRIGYECWLRNIAVALGNATRSESVLIALNQRKEDPSELVREHVLWALANHEC